MSISIKRRQRLVFRFPSRLYDFRNLPRQLLLPSHSNNVMA